MSNKKFWKIVGSLFVPFLFVTISMLLMTKLSPQMAETGVPYISEYWDKIDFIYAWTFMSHIITYMLGAVCVTYAHYLTGQYRPYKKGMMKDD